MYLTNLQGQRVKDGVAALPWTLLHLVFEFPSDPFLFNSAEISILQGREGKCLACTLNSVWKCKYSTAPESNSDPVLEFHKSVGKSSLKDMNTGSEHFWKHCQFIWAECWDTSTVSKPFWDPGKKGYPYA